MRSVLKALLVLLPWRLRRPLLAALFGYELHPESYIGIAWIFPRRLVMRRGSSIGHLTVAKGMELLDVGEGACIGRLNWITAFPLADSGHFAHIAGRRPELVLAEHAAITHRHIIDCTERIAIGRFATVAGYRSQMLTHSIDLRASRQHARPIVVGEYCFVGTASTILGGAVLPDFSVLGAGSLLNKAHERTHRLYAGVPAVEAAVLDDGMQYLCRPAGFVT